MVFYDLPVRLLLLGTVTVFVTSGMVQAQTAGNEQFSSSDGTQNNERPFRHIPLKSPECSGLVHEYWRMTDELHAKAEEGRRAVDPRSRQITQEINALAKERSAVWKNILLCSREANQTPPLDSDEPKDHSDSEASGNPPSHNEGKSLPPFELGTAQNEFYGHQVAVESGGEAPQETGVDWTEWYKKWIQLVNQEVNRKIGNHFRKQGDTNTYSAKINYTVYKDPNNGLMRVQIDTGGYSEGTYKNGVHWGNSARNMTLELNYALNNGRLDQRSSRVPPFPNGTQLKSISRSFTFNYNTDGPEIRLGRGLPTR